MNNHFENKIKEALYIEKFIASVCWSKLIHGKIYWSECETIKLYNKDREAFREEWMCFRLQGNFEDLLNSSFPKIYGKRSTVAEPRNTLDFNTETMYKGYMAHE